MEEMEAMRTRRDNINEASRTSTIPRPQREHVRAHLHLARLRPTFRPTFLTSQVTGTFSCILPPMSSLEEPTSQLSRAKYCNSHLSSALDPICAHLFRVITLRLCESILIQRTQRTSCDANPLPHHFPPSCHHWHLFKEDPPSLKTPSSPYS